MSLIVGKKNLNDTADGETTFESESGPSIKMPSFSKVYDNSSSGVSGIQTKLIISDSNPFQSTSKGQAQGTILSLELSDDSGNELNINGTLEPFDLMIPSKQPAKGFMSSVDLFGITYLKVFYFKLHL